MKICIQGAAFDTPNMGVGALAVGTVRTILHRHPEAELFFLNYEKSSTTYTIQFSDRAVTVPLVNMRFSWRFWLRNNVAFLLFLTVLTKLFPFPALRRRWIAGNTCLRHIDETDLVLAISGGDSFSDIYGLERLLYVSLPQILALWSGKRLILLPQTLGPFKSWFARGIAKYIMKRAEVVYSRDYAGVELGNRIVGINGRTGVSPRRHGATIENLKSRIENSSHSPNPDSRLPIPDSRFPSKIRFCFDVGFSLDPIPPKRVDVVGLEFPPHPGASLVGLNVSGLLHPKVGTRNNRFGLRMDYAKLVNNLIALLIEQKQRKVLLIPHVFGQDDESDAIVCAQVYESSKEKYPGKVGWLRSSHDQSEIKYLIGQCDFFIGSRMHACIGAISQYVPTVAIAYSDKFAGVMESVGVESIVADPRTMGEDEILRLVDQAYEQRAALQSQLRETMPRVKAQVLNLFADIEERPAAA